MRLNEPGNFIRQRGRGKRSSGDIVHFTRRLRRRRRERKTRSVVKLLRQPTDELVKFFSIDFPGVLAEDFFLTQSETALDDEKLYVNSWLLTRDVSDHIFD